VCVCVYWDRVGLLHQGQQFAVCATGDVICLRDGLWKLGAAGEGPGFRDGDRHLEAGDVCVS
jgi:hypothetical protein